MGLNFREKSRPFWASCLASFVVIVLLLPIVVSHGSAQTCYKLCPANPQPTNTTTLQSPTEKIVFNKLTSVLYPDNTDAIRQFHVYNTGTVPAVGISGYAGELVIGNQPASSTAPAQIDSGSIHVSITKEIIPGGNAIVNVTNGIDSRQTGSYTGKVFLTGQNISPISVDVEFNIKHNPFELVGFTIVGVIVAAGVGFTMSYWKAEEDLESEFEKEQKDHKSELEKKRNILMDIKDNIDESNRAMMTNLTEEEWVDLIMHYDDMMDPIKKHKLKLNSGLLTNLLEKFSEQKGKIINKKHEGPKCKPSSNKLSTKEVEELIAKANEKIKHPKLGKLEKSAIKIGKVKANTWTSSNIIFSMIAIVTSVPTTLFSTSYFLGTPEFDVMIAVGVGFTIYRSKDVSKIISGFFKQPPPNSN